MSNRTKSVVVAGAAMAAAGFTHSQLDYSPLASSPVLKAGIVGIVALVAAVLIGAALQIYKVDRGEPGKSE